MACYFLILLLLLIALQLPAATLSQDTATVAQCVPRLLPLATCGPYVQGDEQRPSQPCCDNLKEIYGQQPHCLCILLSDPNTLSSLPAAINASLALQLPALCAIQVDISVCSTEVNGPMPSSPGSQVSLGSSVPNSSTAENSTITGSPVFQTLPRPSSNATAQVFDKSNGHGIFFQTVTDFSVFIVSSVLIILVIL